MCSCKNGKYLSSIIRNSEITFDETIKEIKTVLTKAVPKKLVLTKSTSTNFYILFNFFQYLLLPDKILSEHFMSLRTNQKKFYIGKCIINMETNNRLK